MCDSAADGGARCAASTRPAFAAYVTALAATNGRNDPRRAKIRSQRFDSVHGCGDEALVVQEMGLQAAIAHAATPAGRKEVAAALEQFNDDPILKAQFSKALIDGEQRAAANKEVKKEIKAARVKAERAEKNSTNPLRKNVGNKPENSLAAKWPEVAKLWLPENNLTEDGEQVAAHELTHGSNVTARWQCPEGHQWETRLNNTTAALGRGTPLRCPDCTGRRGRSLARMQEDLGKFQAAIGDDPEAWERLPPALRHAILDRTGLIQGNRDEFSRATAQSLVTGELTLKEVLAARKVEDIDQRVTEGVDEDAETATDRDEDLLGTGTSIDDSDGTTRVDRIMKGAGVASLVDGDEVLMEQILSNAHESLWNEVQEDPQAIDALLTRIKEQAGDNKYQRLVAERFEEDLNRVRNTPLPEGFEARRTRANGRVVEIEPNLMQRRFAVLVEDRKRVANWSGTGAGKTEAAMLAMAHVDAKEAVVFCPAALQEQWASNYRAAYPDDDLRVGMPPAGEVDDPTNGRRRRWIVSYDSLSSDVKVAEERMGALVSRVDGVVFDELHRAKSGDGNASLRSGMLTKFMDKASEANPDLAVVGMTATPAINDLAEPKSLLRLIQGKDPEGFATKPTVRNAVAAYAHMSAAGVRYKPSYRPKLVRDEVVVDITDRLPQISEHVDKLGAGKANASSEPSYMERALMREKAPKIVEMVNASDGPVVVYSHYTSGCTDVLQGKMRAAGISSVCYTGSETQAQREQILKDFQAGKYKVIIGSQPISTGVDGLQDVSRRLIVASPPWTSADDQQLVGRLHRQGQTQDVHVSYVLTEAEVEGEKWSHCRKRLNRVRYKKALSDAAVDGVIPEGELASEAATAKKGLAALHRLGAAVTARRQNAT